MDMNNNYNNNYNKNYNRPRTTGDILKVLSLFDGLSGARIALDRLNIPCDYFASEIDKYAIKISQKNYPDIIQFGDIRNITGKMIGKVDLLIGGSPCQDLSVSKRNRENLQGKQIGLYYELLRLIKETNPRYFLVENVASMKASVKEEISNLLGVQPILINSALVTAQQRRRLYWTNIPGIKQPEDRHIYLKDILEFGYTEKEKSYCVTSSYTHAVPYDYFVNSSRQLIFNKPIRVTTIGKGGQGERIYSIDGKSICLSANGGGRGAKTGLYLFLNEIKPYIRKLMPIECERLQGLPDNYTEGVSDTQRYKMIGNGFTVPVIEHILSHMDIIWNYNK